MMAELEQIPEIKQQIEQKKALSEKAAQLYKQSYDGRVIAIYADGKKKEIRLANSSNSKIMVMTSKNRGYEIDRWDKTPISDITDFKQIDVKAKWLKSINKAIGMLEASGLWVDMLEDLKTARSIGYEKLQESRREFNKQLNDLSNPKPLTYEEKEELEIERIKAIDERLVYMCEPTTVGDKVYPSHLCRKSSILGYMVYPLKIKAMYFGSSEYAKQKLINIAKALQSKTDIREHTTAGYDITFNYQAKDNMAWYSEEYRGCGNGHYYLALNATHALYYEDD